MARPKCCRLVSEIPSNRYFKPRGIPLMELSEVVLSIDEFEAIKLADLQGLYQENAAGKMEISRQTFGRIIEEAHKKIADALINGRAIKIEGGEVIVNEMRSFKCSGCEYCWEIPFGTGRPDECPKCRSCEIHRLNKATGNRAHRGSGHCCRGSKVSSMRNREEK